LGVVGLVERRGDLVERDVEPGTHRMIYAEPATWFAR
jgi:hypothetical protein